MTDVEQDPQVAHARAVGARFSAKQRALMLAFVQDAVRALQEHDPETDVVEAAMDATLSWQAAHMVRVSGISDPAERVRETTRMFVDTRAAEYALAVIRWSALRDLVAAGKTFAEIGALCDMDPNTVLSLATDPPVLPIDQ